MLTSNQDLGSTVWANGPKIRELRKTTSQETLAIEADIGLETLQKCERSGRVDKKTGHLNELERVKKQTLVYLASTFGVRVDVLIVPDDTSPTLRSGMPEYYHSAVEGNWVAFCRDIETNTFDINDGVLPDAKVVPHTIGEVRYDVAIENLGSQIKGSCDCKTPPFDYMSLDFTGVADGTGKFFIDCSRPSKKNDGIPHIARVLVQFHFAKNGVGKPTMSGGYVDFRPDLARLVVGYILLTKL